MLSVLLTTILFSVFVHFSSLVFMASLIYISSFVYFNHAQEKITINTLDNTRYSSTQSRICNVIYKADIFFLFFSSDIRSTTIFMTISGKMREYYLLRTYNFVLNEIFCYIFLFYFLL